VPRRTGKLYSQLATFALPLHNSFGWLSEPESEGEQDLASDGILPPPRKPVPNRRRLLQPKLKAKGVFPAETERTSREKLLHYQEGALGSNQGSETL